MFREDEARANAIKPFSAPVMLEDVLDDDQISRLFAAFRRYGPIDLQLGRHPDQRRGRLPEPVFRGELAIEGVCLDRELDDIFYSRKFMDAARLYRNSKFCVPRQIAFNVNPPTYSQDPGHQDGPAFLGLWFIDTPTWLLYLMSRSRLFDQYRLKMVQITHWFWRGPYGGFTYWPDGPLQQPQRVAPPMWNRAIVAENQYMFHRAESSLPSVECRPMSGLTFDSIFSADPQNGDGWRIQAGNETIARYRTTDLRWMLHWACQLFDDIRDVRRFLDHEEDLTTDRVFDIFVSDLRKEGIKFTMPCDPLNDLEFRAVLKRHYDVATPVNHPPEAPVASFPTAAEIRMADVTYSVNRFGPK